MSPRRDDSWLQQLPPAPLHLSGHNHSQRPLSPFPKECWSPLLLQSCGSNLASHQWCCSAASYEPYQNCHKAQRLKDLWQPKHQTMFLWNHWANVPEVSRIDPEDVAYWLVCSAFLQALQHLPDFPMGRVILVNAVHLMILCKFKLVWADILSKGKDKRKWSKSCGP